MRQATHLPWQWGEGNAKVLPLYGSNYVSHTDIRDSPEGYLLSMTLWALQGAKCVPSSLHSPPFGILSALFTDRETEALRAEGFPKLTQIQVEPISLPPSPQLPAVTLWHIPHHPDTQTHAAHRHGPPLSWALSVLWNLSAGVTSRNDSGTEGLVALGSYPWRPLLETSTDKHHIYAEENRVRGW